jgi:hypothetical protein
MTPANRARHYAPVTRVTSVRLRAVSPGERRISPVHIDHDVRAARHLDSGFTLAASI